MTGPSSSRTENVYVVGTPAAIVSVPATSVSSSVAVARPGSPSPVSMPPLCSAGGSAFDSPMGATAPPMPALAANTATSVAP